MDLILKYNELKSKSISSTDDTNFVRINPHKSHCRIYLFYSKLDGPFLGLFHDNGDLILQEKPFIDGLEIDEVEEDSKRGTRLKPKRQSGEDIFLKLCDHLVLKLKDDAPPRKIARSLLRELKLWKLFWSKSQSPLDKRRLVGLAGELFTLDLLLANSSKRADLVISGWEGPNRGLHDFCYEETLFEVKGSIHTEEMRFHIFSPVQLVQTEEKKLYLVHQIFFWEPLGVSINDVIKNLRTRMSDNQVALFKFEELIHMYGYHEIHHDHYESENLKLQNSNSNIYDVNEDFPKVLAENTHLAIEVNEYSIGVEGCEKQLLGEFEEVLKELKWN
mgnify:CR=1 FL=1